MCFYSLFSSLLKKVPLSICVFILHVNSCSYCSSKYAHIFVLEPRVPWRLYLWLLLTSGINFHLMVLYYTNICSVKAGNIWQISKGMSIGFRNQSSVPRETSQWLNVHFSLAVDADSSPSTHMMTQPAVTLVPRDKIPPSSFLEK